MNKIYYIFNKKDIYNMFINKIFKEYSYENVEKKITV